MAATVPRQVEQFIQREVLPHIPPVVRAVSFEVDAWLVTVHAFQQGPLEDDSYEQMELLVRPLESTLPPREGEPWQVTVTAHRVDAPAMISPIGSLVLPIDATT